ncbi:hypothetical protein [Nocardia salmonicida]|uniref:hypothetical protein n=1 Tax=Nocardia salmonicida TaxID=53431 RepID=UPI0007A423E0|nr:hypothetical protein [Nocardia salmonicida]
MNPVAAALVATELREALTAHTRAVSGPSSTAEADALDRLERAADAAAALLDLTSPPRPAGLGRKLPAGQSVLWLDISTGECGIRHGRVIGETQPQHYDIAVEAPWGTNTEHAISAQYLIPLTPNTEHRHDR